MRRKLIDLLKALEERIPPSHKEAHHAIRYAKYTNGDDATSKDELAVIVNHEGMFHTVFLDDEDLNEQMNVDSVVAQVKDIIQANMASLASS